jgi:hypothetical protein
MKRIKIPLIITFAVILLASNLSGYATAAINKQKEESSNEVLPDFLLRLSEYLSKGNTTELAQIRSQMIEQEKVNRDRIKSTNGAVLNFSPRGGTLLSWPPWYSFMQTVEYTSHPESYGYIEYATRMTGGQDNSYAHLHTDGWNENYENPMGGEAFAAGYMYRNVGSGDIYVRCRRGPHSGNRPPWQDYVIVYTSSNINGPWQYRGYAQVPSYSATDLYIGTTYSLFSCISVMCWTPPPYPDPYPYPDYFNCVEVDNVLTAYIY